MSRWRSLVTRTLFGGVNVAVMIRHWAICRIYPDVGLGSINSQLLLDLGLSFGRTGGTICRARVPGVEVQSNHGNDCGGNSHPSLSIHLQMVPPGMLDRPAPAPGTAVSSWSTAQARSPDDPPRGPSDQAAYVNCVRSAHWPGDLP